MIINEITKGIPHIEDLPINEFLRTLKNIHEYQITEKVDGSQILFGIDEHGFYTSRETKGGIRIYNEEDYGMTFSSTYMRSAHKLLEQALPMLKGAGMKSGDQVEAEVLYGELPNVVPYSADTNYLIFLRTTEGTVNIDSLKQKLDGRLFSIPIMSSYTADGKTIQIKEEINSWKFSRAPAISNQGRKIYDKMSPVLLEMTSYLMEPSGISTIPNAVIEIFPLNKIPVWCESKNWKFIKEQVKEKKEEIKQILRENFISEIKSILLDQLVHNRKSEFGPLVEDGGWIEGVVLRHSKSGKMVKIVDKDTFGTIREFAWKERNNLTERAKSIEGNMSFLGSLYVTMATSIGHPSLGTMQAKNYLRKVGTITEERIANLSDDINAKSVKEYWLSLCEQMEIDLNRKLDKYAKETSNTSVRINPRLQKAINKRTFETFASTLQKINVIKESTLQAKDGVDLIMILVGKQLGEL